MKTILFFLFLSLLVGCKKECNDQPNAAAAAPQPPPGPPVIIIENNQRFSSEYIRGYNDGYTKAWLAPGHWLFANEYRSGWEAGNADRNGRLPHRFHR